jgi:N,N'-diacetyllegionaminate synthase
VARRQLHDSEKNSRDAVRRSVFIKQEAPAGKKLGDCEVEFRRPGFGITPDRYEELIELKLVRGLKAGHMLEYQDLCG